MKGLAVASKTEAQDAIFNEIAQVLTEESPKYHGSDRATIVLNLSLAYRAAAGGPQPGGILAGDKS